jgi:hypothetical protein
MRKETALFSIVLTVVIFHFSLAHAQMAGKAWDKTVTLPGGEAILDMSGEWDFQCEFYGPFYWVKPTTYSANITQEGSSFSGVTLTDTKWQPKGTETIKGELDRDGFKAVYKQVHARDTYDDVYVFEPCEWEISENGNKVMLDCGERIRATLNRR